MIVPGTRVRLAHVPLERILVTECQRRYPERVLHYVRLLSDPAHADHAAGFVHLAPYGTREPDGTPLYTVLDGHHRYVAHLLAGRTRVLALILVEPGQPGYDDAGDGLEVAS